MEMNSQIREIIDLDRRAEAIIEDARQICAAMEQETAGIIKSHRETVIQETKDISKRNYDAQMQEAEKEKNHITDEMLRKLEQVKGDYLIHKEEWAKEILENLLRQEG